MTKILIIGAGGIAHRHVEHIKQIPGCSIVGVCDLNRERAGKLAAKADAPVFTELEAALAATTPDYAAILTPRQVRESIIDHCIERNLPFLVEKPPCDRLSTGRRIQKKIVTSGILHSVGFMHRWQEAVNQVTTEIAGEKISLISIRFTAPFATAPVFATYPDPYLVERSGGLVGDQGIHAIDLIRYLCQSEVRDIQVTGLNQLLPRSPQVSTCDAVCWNLRLDNGILINHAHTWCGPDWNCQLNLVTDKSRIEVDLYGNTAKGKIRGKDWSFTGIKHEFRLQHEGFIRALSNHDQSLVRSSFADALKTFVTTAKINRQLYGQSAELDEE